MIDSFSELPFCFVRIKPVEFKLIHITDHYITFIDSSARTMMLCFSCRSVYFLTTVSILEVSCEDYILIYYIQI